MSGSNKAAWALAALTAASVSAWHPSASAATPFDGQWSVQLVCDDTTDRMGPVKGYEYRFSVTIADGAVAGQYGARGQPASIFYTGRVAGDGELEIRADGNTGNSEYAAGRVVRGTQYGYTLHGRLAGTTGQASRREVRPCTANFSRN